jgi:hypothetical protein
MVRVFVLGRLQLGLALLPIPPSLRSAQPCKHNTQQNRREWKANAEPS